ncbi:DUF6946 family protein [Piscinibacter sakaiensis]|uniref:DUF6946 family protein n=1 Tax=Piscinibacter sakaiensis TaxID=1547922 RepID=UPI003AAF468D
MQAASARIEAKRFCAHHALMPVHSFSAEHIWFDDYAAFAALVGVEVEVGKITLLGVQGGVHLHIGLVRGDLKYVER